MLNDAIATEAYRLWHNRSVRFWGFLFMPLAFLVFHLVLNTYLRVRIGTGIGVDLGLQVTRSLGLAGSPFVHVFFALGAAGIFASEYRWETWRLILPRNSRTNLIAAKFIVYGIAVALSVAALGLMGLLQTLYGAALSSTAPVFPGIDFILRAFSVFAACWIEVMLLGAFVALVAVSSRATIGAAISGIMFAFVQSIAMTQLSLADLSVLKLALFPRFSAEMLEAFTAAREIGPDLFVSPTDAGLAAIFLVCWTCALSAAAYAVFQRQDLSRE